jgi:microsomal dipeptidase-like Zn-dependent dipeptidase
MRQTITGLAGLVSATISLLIAAACDKTPSTPEAMEAEIAAIHEKYVFADSHSHLSRFHRANVETVAPEEIDIYRSNHIDLVVANISSDMAYFGEYENRDGAVVEEGKYKPKPGEPYSLAADRLARLQKTFELGIAVQASTPDDVLIARERNEVAILPALEGADAFEGKIENLQEMYKNGLRLVQFLHFRNNELGHNQTHPYSPGGLTDFGIQVVKECNRLGLIIDLAHSNNETIMDVLKVSKDPVIFSHGGVQALLEQDRAVSDDEIEAIAKNGGMVGIWPHGKYIEDVKTMVDFIEHVIEVGGIDHVGIGSDLRGISAYAKGFDEEANFRAIAAELITRGYSDKDVGKVMGANFFRIWQEVSD